MKYILAALCFVVYCSATQVKQCPNHAAIDNLNNRVTIGACSKAPCRLRKDTVVNITLNFKPETKVEKLVTVVNANILGIPFPFVGVDGADACQNIYKQDGVTKVGCNMKGGEEYVYKSNIEVLKIYPTIKTVVHWALTDQTGKDVICFEVPARITN